MRSSNADLTVCWEYEMLISSPNPNQLLLQFDSELARKEFEQWIRLMPSATLELIPSDETPPSSLPHKIPTDLQLALMESKRRAEAEDARQRIAQRERNQSGVMPFRVQPNPR